MAWDRNALIFVDLPSPEPARTAQFYSEIFGWATEPHPDGIFHVLKPGGERDQGASYSNIGVYSVADPRPDPHADETRERRHPRIYIGTPSRAEQNRLLDEAEARGATVLWRDRYWAEFEGFHGAFRDPWGNEIIVWAFATPTDAIPADSPY